MHQRKTPMPAKSDLTSAQLTSYLSETFGSDINADQVRSAADHFSVSYPTAVKRLRQYNVGRGKWNLTVEEARQQFETTVASPTVIPAHEQNLIPAKDITFVPFGNFADVKKILSSGIFYPVFITGLSGNGKTFSVEQACAALNKELIRVNITIETDEDDLIGGFRLVNGETVWHNGPVVEALQRGAVLLLDEIDLASNKIMCLQSILEGKGVFLKKTGQYIQPAAGFNIIATANTKGKGSDDGRFIGTNVLNEAFLERFALTFEQEYPSTKVETKILERLSQTLNIDDNEFCTKLADWADVIRKTFNDGGIDEVISTRRLSHIIRAYAIWGDRLKAIKVCTNRFDEETKQSFIELYGKLDADVDTDKNEDNASNQF
jgi:hypothetical protein